MKHTKKITNAIKLLNDYFIAMIEVRQYNVIKASDATISIELMSGEKFSFWYWKEAKNLTTYQGLENNFMALTFTDEQKETLFNQFTSDVKEFLKSQPETEKRRAEYLKLKAEFESTPA